jgi:hypothetical protein
MLVQRKSGGNMHTPPLGVVRNAGSHPWQIDLIFQKSIANQDRNFLREGISCGYDPQMEIGVMQAPQPNRLFSTWSKVRVEAPRGVFGVEKPVDGPALLHSAHPIH